MTKARRQRLGGDKRPEALHGEGSMVDPGGGDGGMVESDAMQDAGETADDPASGMNAADGTENAMALTVNLVKAYVANHTVPVAQLGVLLEQTHRTVLGLSTFRVEPAEVAPVATSVRDDSIMCLDCGKLFRSLKRHLGVHHALTPTQYRIRWNLPPEYPMVAPEYAASRSRLAISMGFGGKAGQKLKRRSRPKSAE